MKFKIFGIIAALIALATPAVAQTPLPPTTILSFGAKCNGTFDDSTAIAAMLTKLGTAVIPAPPLASQTCYINPVGSLGVSVGTGQRVTGLAGAKIKIGGGQRQGFLLTGDRAQVDHLYIDVNGAIYGIISDTAGPYQAQYVHDNYFVGNNTGADLFFQNGGTGTGLAGPVSQRNVFDKTSATAVQQQLIFTNSLQFVSDSDRFINYRGFGIQTRWSRGMINNINTYSPNNASAPQTATGGQTSFTFTASTNSPRYKLQVNGYPVNSGSGGYTVTPNGSNTSFSVTTPPMTNGDVVSMVAYNSLEPVNINSSSSVTINGGIIVGSGDGGIVVGADYYFNGTDWLPINGNPALLHLSDIPYNIQINGVYIENTYYSAISFQAGCTSMTIGDGYVLRNFAMGENAAPYNSAISVVYAGGNNFTSPQCITRIGAGVIDNTSLSGTSGVVVNGTGLTNAGSADAQIQIGAIDFRGNISKPLNLDANLSLPDNQALITNVDVPHRRGIEYPVQPDFNTAVIGGKPADNDWWSYAVTGSGVNSDSTNKLGGANSIITIAGSELELTPGTESASGSFFAGGLIKVEFDAKSTGACSTATPTCSYVSVFTKNGSQFPNVPLYISNTSWQHYTLFLSAQNVTQLYQLRIGAPGGGVTANIQYLKLTSIPLN